MSAETGALLDFAVQKNTRTFQQRSEPHFHDGYEVFLCLDGGGQFIVQEKGYPLCRGTLILLPPSTVHRCIAEVAAYECYVLHFSEQTLRRLSNAQTDLRSIFGSRVFYVSLTEEQVLRLSALMDSGIGNSAEFGRDLRGMAAFVELLVSLGELLRGGVQEQLPQPSKPLKDMLPVISYLQEHYREDISLGELSNRFFISKYYLCHKFKKATGFSVGIYLTNYRIRVACTLLRAGVSVQEAGEQAGFRNNAHFIRCFGQIMGVSPGKYVRSLDEG